MEFLLCKRVGETLQEPDNIIHFYLQHGLVPVNAHAQGGD